MMDCDTTGVEPDIALIKYKKLVGEGFLKIVNQTVPAALRKLGYDAEQVEEIVAYINERETIEGAPHAQARAPVGLRLRVQAGQRRSLHPLHGPRPDDGRGPAVHLRRDQQDRQHAGGRDGRGDRAGLPRGLEAGPQGDRDLPRQQQAQPAADDRQEGRRRGRRHRGRRRSSRPSSPPPRPRRASRIAAASRTSGPPSPTSSTSPATRATSRSASTRTASRARSS